MVGSELGGGSLDPILPKGVMGCPRKGPQGGWCKLWLPCWGPPCLPFSQARDLRLSLTPHPLVLPCPKLHFQLFCTNVITEQWVSLQIFPGPAGVIGFNPREAGPQAGAQMLETHQGLAGGDSEGKMA